MRPEDQLLIACTRQDFRDIHQTAVVQLERDTAVNWHYVVATATRHNVAPIVYTNLVLCAHSSLAIPPGTLQQFEQLCYRNVALMSGVAVKLAEGLTYLRSQSIDVMLIKGVALEVLVYKQPWYTVHDVDLVLRRRREDLTPRCGRNRALLPQAPRRRI